MEALSLTQTLAFKPGVGFLFVVVDINDDEPSIPVSRFVVHHDAMDADDTPEALAELWRRKRVNQEGFDIDGRFEDLNPSARLHDRVCGFLVGLVYVCHVHGRFEGREVRWAWPDDGRQTASDGGQVGRVLNAPLRVSVRGMG
jgi:hypothetical protein